MPAAAALLSFVRSERRRSLREDASFRGEGAHFASGRLRERPWPAARWSTDGQRSGPELAPLQTRPRDFGRSPRLRVGAWLSVRNAALRNRWPEGGLVICLVCTLGAAGRPDNRDCPAIGLWVFRDSLAPAVCEPRCDVSDRRRVVHRRGRRARAAGATGRVRGAV